MMKQLLLLLAALVFAVDAQIHPDIIEDAHLDAVSSRLKVKFMREFLILALYSKNSLDCYGSTVIQPKSTSSKLTMDTFWESTAARAVPCPHLHPESP